MSIPQREQQPDRRRVIGELRDLWLRQAKHDVEAIGSALKVGVVSPDEVVGILHGRDLLALPGNQAEHGEDAA